MLLAKYNDLTELQINLRWQLKLEKTPRQLELIKEVQERIKKLEEEIERILEHSYNSHWL
jgi:hypothetical protein